MSYDRVAAEDVLKLLLTKWPLWLNNAGTMTDTDDYRRIIARAKTLAARSTRRGNSWDIKVACLMRDFEKLRLDIHERAKA